MKKMADASKADLKAAEKAAKAKEAALEAAKTQIEREFGAGSLMKLGDARSRSRRSRPAPCRSTWRSAWAASRAGGWSRSSAGVVGEDHARLPHHRRGPGARRGVRVRRRRACDRPDLRRADRRQHGRAARLAARLRRAGARDRRRPRALGRGRRGRRGLRRGADAAGGARGPDGRADGRPSGAADVAGAAQAHRQSQPGEHDLPVHEPDPGEDRSHVRLPGDPARWSRAQVLFLAAARHPPDRDPQGGHRGGRQPVPRQGRQEQGCAAVQAGRVRHRVWGRHLARRLPARPGARTGPRDQVRLVLLLRRAAAGPGSQQHEAVPGRESRPGPRDRGQDPRHSRDRARSAADRGGAGHRSGDRRDPRRARAEIEPEAKAA